MWNQEVDQLSLGKSGEENQVLVLVDGVGWSLLLTLGVVMLIRD